MLITERNSVRRDRCESFQLVRLGSLAQGRHVTKQLLLKRQRMRLSDQDIRAATNDPTWPRNENCHKIDDPLVGWSFGRSDGPMRECVTQASGGHKAAT